jgi:hypothetical protein
MSTVTCHTEGCENEDIPLEMQLTWTDPDTGDTYTVGSVSCGPCGQPITDIQPPLEETQP